MCCPRETHPARYSPCGCVQSDEHVIRAAFVDEVVAGGKKPKSALFPKADMLKGTWSVDRASHMNDFDVEMRAKSVLSGRHGYGEKNTAVAFFAVARIRDRQNDMTRARVFCVVDDAIEPVEGVDGNPWHALVTHSEREREFLADHLMIEAEVERLRGLLREAFVGGGPLADLHRLREDVEGAR
jgi:hypothetical protein